MPPHRQACGKGHTAETHTAGEDSAPGQGVPLVSELLSPEISPACTAQMGKLRLCRSNLAKLPLSAGTGDQMCHLLRGGTSSCAGGKGEAHWAPRQPQDPPLTSSSGTRSLSSRAPPPWLTWLRPCVSPAPRSLHPAQRRRPLSARSEVLAAGG